MQPKSEDDGAGMSAGLEAFWSAVNALSGYQQADEDGVMALASRQAIEEVLLGIASMEQRIVELEAENKRLREVVRAAQNWAEWKKEFDTFDGDRRSTREYFVEAESALIAALAALKETDDEGS